MGGGGKSQLTGYSYFLDMAYAFSSKVDKLKGFFIDDEIVYPMPVSTANPQIKIVCKASKWYAGILTTAHNYFDSSYYGFNGPYSIQINVNYTTKHIYGHSGLPPEAVIHCDTNQGEHYTTNVNSLSFGFDLVTLNVDTVIAITADVSFAINQLANVTSNTAIVTQTGKHAELYGSNNNTSNVSVYLGDQTESDSYLTSKTGSSIIYKDICYLVFPQAFIGDNVRSVPNYGVLLQHTDLIAGANYQTIQGTMNGFGISTANPAYVILDILLNHLKLPNINITSFNEAAYILYEEGLGINFVLETQSKVLDIINNILEIIDGIVSYNYDTDMFELILIRKINTRYLIEQCYTGGMSTSYITGVINILNATDISIKQKGVYDLFNTYKFEYTNITTTQVPKKDSKVLTNQSLVNQQGFVKTKDIDLTMIATQEALNLVISRTYKKLSTPTFDISFKISALDIAFYKTGDLLLFQPDLESSVRLPFRIIKISGDSAKDGYYIIEGKQDIFQNNIISSDLSFITPTPGGSNNSANTPPTNFVLYPCTPENASVRSVFPVFSYTEDNVDDAKFYAYEYEDQKMQVYPYIYSTVTAINNYNPLDEVNYVDNQIEIIVHNEGGDLYEINGTDSDLQRIVYTALWGQEAISIKTCTNIGVNTFKITGIIRAVQDKISVHTVGEDFWLSPFNGNQAIALPITSITPTIYIYTTNGTQSSPINWEYCEYDFAIEKPYPPNSVSKISKGGSVDIVWTPRVRLKGANYRNCDMILAGEDEGATEGWFNIYKDSTFVTDVTPSAYCTELVFNVTEVGEWSVESQIGNYRSVKINITITAEDLL